jgi:hypothetical protein
MTSDDSLLLLLRRLDKIERKLDRMMEELQPAAIPLSIHVSRKRAFMIAPQRRDWPRSQGRENQGRMASFVFALV